MLLALFEFGYILAANKFGSSHPQTMTAKVFRVEFSSTRSTQVVNKEVKKIENHKKLDKICMLLSLIYFVIFNLGYWTAIQD